MSIVHFTLKMVGRELEENTLLISLCNVYVGIYSVDLIDDCLYNWNIKLYK